ncbi:MAG TPA: cytochrome c family protein [Bosea sp. (in: a-proteobacteria)]|jgi:cytochrome c|uniref:c-type cytochrome n=1 Tax=Bosea sp. (in: a-proteobacteria) TaxID=1871050 RepID=UPI002DDCF98B|nr:cytochrome c family protein [Bosea sp. (in: a-proteobacteria)]HEV2554116.1 cytochrome c family protein [Bosea sp. (in: a-proteobacteria)]
MDIETNKIAGAVLSTLLVVMGLNMTAGIVFAPTKPAVPGFDLPSDEPVAAASAPAAAAEEPIAVRLAKADVARGEKAMGACKACHTFEKGGANKIGPHLYDVYARNKGAVDGFAYSAAMKAKSGEKWEAEQLDGFLKNPKAYMPGTIMAYAGVGRPDTRADMVAYLNSLADAPKPLPTP